MSETLTDLRRDSLFGESADIPVLPDTEYQFGLATRQIMPTASDFFVSVLFSEEDGSGFIAAEIPGSDSGTFEFTEDATITRAETVTASFRLEITMSPDGTGATASSGTILLDAVFLRQQGVDPTDIPTLDTWALLALVLLLIGGATRFLRRS